MNFERVKRRIEDKYRIRIEPVKGGSKAQIPFRLFRYNERGQEEIIPTSEWATELPKEVYNQIKGLTSVVFGAPIHELPSYWRQVNPDVYKEELAGYLEKQPGYVHEMSSEMSKAYFEAALETGDPIFVDGTGSNYQKMKDQIESARKAGYRISLVLVIVPLTVNHIRNAIRPRNVAPRIITDHWKKIRDNFVALRTIVDKSRVVINRNDPVDISIYRANADKINHFIRTNTNFDSLYDLIAKESPSELSDWGKLLKSSR